MTEPSGSDVCIRDVQDDDLEVFFEQQLNPEATAMAAFPARTRDAFMAHWAKIATIETAVRQTVVVDDQVAGNMLSWEQDGQRFVGYWIGREFWGRGIATSALRLLLDQVPSRPLHAEVAAHNVGSIRVLEKCGFRPAVVDGKAHSAPGADGIEELLLVLDE